MSILNLRQDVLSSISRSIASQFQTTNVSQITNQITNVSVSCGDWCEKCIDKFVKINDIPEVSREGVLDNLRKGVCKGGCVCNLADISISNTILFFPSVITDISVDTNAISTQVNQEINTKYKTDNPVSPTIINNIITSVKSEIIVNINQTLTAIQEISLKGGGTIKGVDMRIMINAIMKVLVGNTQALQDLTTITNNVFTEISKNVEKQVSASFSSVFEANKKILIFLVVVIIVLALAFVFFLLSKTMTGRVEAIKVQEI